MDNNLLYNCYNGNVFPASYPSSQILRELINPPTGDIKQINFPHSQTKATEPRWLTVETLTVKDLVHEILIHVFDVFGCFKRAYFLLLTFILIPWGNKGPCHGITFNPYVKCFEKVFTFSSMKLLTSLRIESKSPVTKSGTKLKAKEKFRVSE